MTRPYTNPPIVEAICEFQFVPSQPWDMTIPGLVYDKIKGEFPQKRQRMGFDVGFHPQEGFMEQKVEMIQRMQFLRSDESALIQVAPDMISVNHLRPYSSWEEFKPLALKGLATYRGIATPQAFKRIGLRYINRIDFRQPSIELSDYFHYYPSIPQELPQSHGPFDVRVMLSYQERDLFSLSLRTVEPQNPDTLSLLLDLDYFMDKPEGIEFDHAPTWLEAAHATVEQAFEACITDRCRALFQRKE